MLFNPGKVLVLSPHPDDGEIGCGGTIASLKAKNSVVHHVLFSCAEKYDGETMDKIERVREFADAQKILGTRFVTIYEDGRHRELHTQRVFLLKQLHELRLSFNPEIVFMPCIGDLHQDHDTITREALRVFKGTTVLGYEMAWNNLQFQSQAFVRITKKDLIAKINAVKAYKSQAKRIYCDARYIQALAISRGVQIGHEYAEAFEVIRWVV